MKRKDDEEGEKEQVELDQNVMETGKRDLE